MRIENYSDQYKQDVICIIEKFHVLFLQKYDGNIYRRCIEKTLFEFSGEQSKNVFLLIIEGKCVGVLAGIEMKSYINEKRIFSEIFWYVDEPYGMFALSFIKQVEMLLKEQGFSIIIMAVLDSDKAEKIKKLYEMTGYQYLETHYMKNL